MSVECPEKRRRRQETDISQVARPSPEPSGRPIVGAYLPDQGHIRQQPGFTLLLSLTLRTIREMSDKATRQMSSRQFVGEISEYPKEFTYDNP